MFATFTTVNHTVVAVTLAVSEVYVVEKIFRQNKRNDTM